LNSTSIINVRIDDMTFLRFTTRVPARVLQAAKEAGGSVTQIPGEDFRCLRCEFGDACYNVLNEWVSTTHDTDPCVTVTFAPPQRVLGTEVYPPHELVGYLLVEASSIVHHYASLRIEDFSGGPPALLGPLSDAVDNVRLHHAQVAFSALHAQIQSVNDPNYPIISNLPSLSYVCNVSVRWANAVMVTSIFRP
jgi:hypothetical protein